MIYIFTASIGSGKTTALQQWAEKSDEVHGILTPDVNGKRVFMNVHTKEQFPMEAVADEETISVGRFTFGKTNFEQAIQVIRNAINKDGWLVIDEIGPLELRGEGFHDVLKEVLAQRNDRLIVVVRDGMTEKIKRYFGMITAAVITDINLL